MVKDSYFQIRCTKEELDGIKKDAARAGYKTMSEYILALVAWANKRMNK